MVHPKCVDQCGCSQIACDGNNLELAEGPDECRDVGGGHHLEIFVGRPTAQASHGLHRVEVADACAFEKRTYEVEAECAGTGVDKVQRVAEEDAAYDAPVVVDIVGIEERHAPPVLPWRETAEEEHACGNREEWLKRMVFHHWCRRGGGCVFESHSWLFLCKDTHFSWIIAVLRLIIGILTDLFRNFADGKTMIRFHGKE